METGAFRVLTTPLGHAVGVPAADQQDHELVPAQPGDGAVRPHAVLEPAGNLDEHLVPGMVAQDVVDFLEVVQVQEQHVHRFRGSAVPRRPVR